MGSGAAGQRDVTRALRQGEAGLFAHRCPAARPADPLPRLMHQLLIPDPMRLIHRGALPLVVVGRVLLVVPLVPHHLAVALEGEDVGGDAVEKPAVVADDHRAAGKAQQRLFQRAQRIDVQIVGRLVEQQEVAAALQQLGQVQPVALAAGEGAHLLLLVGAAEVEAGRVGPRVDRAAAELELVLAPGDLLVDRLVGIEIVAALVHIGDLHRRAHLEGTAVGLLLAGDHPEQRGLARAVRPDHAHDAAARQREGQILEQEPVAESLGDVARDHHLVAQPLGDRDDDLGAALGLPLGLLAQLLVAGDAGLALGLAGAGDIRTHSSSRCSVFCRADACFSSWPSRRSFLLQPGRVVALPRDARAPIELENPAGHVVEEVAVVGDRHHGAGEFGQVALQPRHALGVEVVGGLVEQEHVGLLQEQPAERHPAPLAAGDLRDVGLARREPERVHRHVDLVVQLPEPERVDALLKIALLLQQPGHLVVVHRLGELGADLVELVEHRLLLAHPLHHVAAHVLGRIELGFLRQVADLGSRQRARLAEEVLVHPGHDAQQGGLPGAVGAEDADLGAGIEREIDALEDLAGGGTTFLRSRIVKMYSPAIGGGR